MSITNSQSLLKLTSIESVTPPNHLSLLSSSRPCLLCLLNWQAGYHQHHLGTAMESQLCFLAPELWLRKTSYFCFTDYAKAFDCVEHSKQWKVLKEMGIPDHLTCLLRIPMQVKKQQLEPDMEQQAGSKLGKRLSPCLFKLYA